MLTDTLIIGGGLAGLALADRLHRSGRRWHLLEAFDHLGGRILSPEIHGANFDLGPAWFWPGQARISELTRRYGLRVFEQHSQGTICFQDQTGAVHRNRGFASMQGSLRISGGMGALISSLERDLPSDRISLNAMASHVHLESGRVRVTANGSTYFANQVVLAVPPRVAENSIVFSPELPSETNAALRNVPTWMAGQAKIIAVFDKPYWRNSGYSGDAMSHRGPMVEIHDASPVTGGPYGLFGFVGVPPHLRAQHQSDVLRMAHAQLIDIFGEELSDPLELRIQDWARISAIATERDQQPVGGHPQYGTPSALKNVWGGRILFGSTEVASTYGGFLEGALEAAEAIQREIKSSDFDKSRVSA